MLEQIYIFGHKNPDTDSICSSIVKEKLNRRLGYERCFAKRLGNVNKETQYVLNYLGIEPPELIEKAKILGVIDHHRISNFETKEPLYYTARPYGCTSTILYKEYKQRGLEIDRQEAILMASSIISDTLLLKSPTTTNHDIRALDELEKIAGIDIKQYGLEMLKAGTDLDDFTAEQLVNLDAKSLSKDDKKYVIAQVNTVSIEDVLKRQDELEKAINDEIGKNNLDLFVLAITDILNSNSEIISLGKSAKLVENAFNVKLENNRAFLEGVVSRKKQLLPNIEKNI